MQVSSNTTAPSAFAPRRNISTWILVVIRVNGHKMATPIAAAVVTSQEKRREKMNITSISIND